MNNNNKLQKLQTKIPIFLMWKIPPKKDKNQRNSDIMINKDTKESWSIGQNTVNTRSNNKATKLANRE